VEVAEAMLKRAAHFADIGDKVRPPGTFWGEGRKERWKRGGKAQEGPLE
jgi:hypothetical protein